MLCFAVEEEEIEDTLFLYQVDIEELIPPKPAEAVLNPYYRVADLYEPCDNSITQFGSANVSTIRGLGEGIMLAGLDSASVVVSEWRVRSELK